MGRHWFSPANNRPISQKRHSLYVKDVDFYTGKLKSLETGSIYKSGMVFDMDEILTVIYQCVRGPALHGKYCIYTVQRTWSVNSKMVPTNRKSYGKIARTCNDHTHVLGVQ